MRYFYIPKIAQRYVNNIKLYHWIIEYQFDWTIEISILFYGINFVHSFDSWMF